MLFNSTLSLFCLCFCNPVTMSHTITQRCAGVLRLEILRGLFNPRHVSQNKLFNWLNG